LHCCKTDKFGTVFTGTNEVYQLTSLSVVKTKFCFWLKLSVDLVTRWRSYFDCGKLDSL